MEIWDIYDKNGNKTGRKTAKGKAMEHDDYHLAVEAWIVNSKCEILIQQRSKECILLPNIWGLTTGRVLSNESSIQGCIREIGEELGVVVTKNEMHFIRRIIRNDGTNMIWDLYMVRKNIMSSAFQLQKSEVSQVKWVSADEFARMIEKGEIFHYPEIYDVLTYVKQVDSRKPSSKK